jgi:tryptophanyl-tRNA synthetase
MSVPKKLFSGIQPTGTVHIGNYFGAIRNWVALQETHDCIYCIVDYHAITIEYDIANMQNCIIDSAATNIAAGVDPNKCSLFVQSMVPEHTELCWILNSVCNMGSLERMTQYKEKSKQHSENINVGLFDYPVLQAADIMLYKAEVVPVGEDQLQHLELTREIARKFNFRYGDVFPICKEFITPAARVRGLDGEAKMSKSLGNHVSLTEEAEELRKKIMPAKTDIQRQRRTDPGDPKVCNVFSYHQLFSTDADIQEIDQECRSAGIGCVDCKKRLIANMETMIAPIRERKKDLLTDPDTLRDTLNMGAKKVKTQAVATMEEVRSAMGLRF